MGGCMTKGKVSEGAKHEKKRESATHQIKRKYHIHSKVLGSGGFGKVFLAESVADASFKVAIKAISKEKLGDDIKQLKAEIKILQTLDHPNIVKYYETYENKEYVYVVMEYCPGGDLFDLITKKTAGGAL